MVGGGVGVSRGSGGGGGFGRGGESRGGGGPAGGGPAGGGSRSGGRSGRGPAGDSSSAVGRVGTGPATGEHGAVELRVCGTVPPCPRCGAPLLLVARYPHTWHNRAGRPVPGFREAPLCRSCDNDTPAGADLLALLALIDGGGRAADAGAGVAAERERFGSLVHAWLDTVRERTPETGDLAGEESRWWAGDL
ncbi:DUF6300 family protein [Streptomyces sp. NPDC050560]|uniref:DUF6300 family protein n=1 Tax=Streptomyces sp. NPDC050560 TaxID=3365630 RepID=UPI00378914B9